MGKKKERPDKFSRVSELPIREVTPMLNVRYRNDNVCFSGGKISFGDFPKFVRRGDLFIPLVCTEEFESDLVLDLSPLLAIGVAETLGMLLGDKEVGHDKFLDWCHNLPLFRDWPSLISCADGIANSEEDVVVFATMMRSGLIDFRFPMIRNVFNTLMALRLSNQKLFCMAIVEAMQSLYPFINMFTVEELRASILSSSPGDSTYSLNMRLVLKKMLKFKAVKCGGLFSKHYATDCRGLGVGFFWLLMWHLYHNFAPTSPNKYVELVNERKTKEYITKKLSSSIGNDAVARYLETGVLDSAECGTELRLFAELADVPTVDCQADGPFYWEFGQGLFESSRMYIHALGTKPFDTPGMYMPVDCHYGSRRTIYRALLDFAISERGKSRMQRLQDDNHEKLMKDLMARLGVDRIRDSVVREARAEARVEAETLQKEVDSLKVRLNAVSDGKADAEDLVVKKQAVIDNLLAEVRELRAKVQNIYEEDIEADEEIVSDVSVEEMLAFVNQFHLVLIGGIDTLRSRMESMGFTNFDIIQQRGQFRGQDVSGDFFCICTRFVSHRQVREVESRNSDKLDQFFYFNGTNTDALLRVCYDFLKSWFEKSTL